MTLSVTKMCKHKPQKELQFKALHLQYKDTPHLVYTCQLPFFIACKCPSATTEWCLDDLQTICFNNKVAWLNGYCHCSGAASRFCIIPSISMWRCRDGVWLKIPLPNDFTLPDSDWSSVCTAQHSTQFVTITVPSPVICTVLLISYVHLKMY
jgi:hypothetical protein